MLLITMLTSAIGLELFQTANMLLKGDAIEFALETDDDATEESESKKLETKDTFDKEILQPYIMPCAFASTIEKAKLSTFYLVSTHQNQPSIQDLPPEA